MKVLQGRGGRVWQAQPPKERKGSLRGKGEKVTKHLINPAYKRKPLPCLLFNQASENGRCKESKLEGGHGKKKRVAAYTERLQS